MLCDSTNAPEGLMVGEAVIQTMRRPLALVTLGFCSCSQRNSSRSLLYWQQRLLVHPLPGLLHSQYQKEPRGSWNGGVSPADPRKEQEVLLSKLLAAQRRA